MAEVEYKMRMCVRGYHFYQQVWEAARGEVLAYRGTIAPGMIHASAASYLWLLVPAGLLQLLSTMVFQMKEAL